MEEDFIELMTRAEPLVPELRPYLQKGPLGKMIHHPLIIEFTVDPERAARINKQFQFKNERAAEALAEKNFHRYIGLHERPYRLQAFMRIHDRIDEDREYWELLGWIWSDSENIWQHMPRWRSIWRSKRPGRDFMMDDDERAKLAALPDEIEIWRGIQHKSAAKGLSWTMDQEKAIWFAKRWRRKGKPIYLISAKVKKEDVLAVFLGRNESEIVTMKPFDVKVRTINAG